MLMASCRSEPSSQKMSDFRDMQILQVRRTWVRLLAHVNLSKGIEPIFILICSLKGS